MHSPLGKPEQLKAQRFRIALLVELQEGTGITRDLSVCGVFFDTDRAFVRREIIEFILVLEYLDPGQPMRMQCSSRVLRIERHYRMVRVAVAIMAYRFDQHTRVRVESSQE